MEERVWEKRLHAQPDEVLALNAIRTPWAVSRFVVETFRGERARRLGFKEVWVVGWSETLTDRLGTQSARGSGSIGVTNSRRPP